MPLPQGKHGGRRRVRFPEFCIKKKFSLCIFRLMNVFAYYNYRKYLQDYLA